MNKQLLLLSALVLAFCLFFLSNCKKDKDGHFTISGRVVDSCHTRNPVENVKVTLRGNNKSTLLGRCDESITETATTDKDGKFSISFTSKCRNSDFFLEVGSLGTVSGQVLRDNQNVGDIVMRNNTALKVIVDTDTAYSTADTLFYNIKRSFVSPLDSTFSFITGPFTNKQVISVLDSISPFSAIIGSKNTMQLRWILKSGTRVYKPKTTNTIGFDFPVSACVQNNEAVLKIGK